MATANAASIIIPDELGITPEVQGKLDRAAKLCREALEQVEEAFQAADVDTDAERRCRDAIGELEGVLMQLEWGPPKEMHS